MPVQVGTQSASLVKIPQPVSAFGLLKNLLFLELRERFAPRSSFNSADDHLPLTLPFQVQKGQMIQVQVPPEIVQPQIVNLAGRRKG